MMACWKQNNFVDPLCSKEIRNFYMCVEKAQVCKHTHNPTDTYSSTFPLLSLDQIHKTNVAKEQKFRFAYKQKYWDTKIVKSILSNMWEPSRPCLTIEGEEILDFTGSKYIEADI